MTHEDRRRSAPENDRSGDGLVGRHLTRTFESRAAVCDVSIEVSGGQLFGVIGPDGAGKTTLIRMLTGLVQPDEGEVTVRGRPMGDQAQQIRQFIGYMPQHYSLYGDLSVDENLHFFGHLFGLASKELDERADELLEITRLCGFGDRRAADLSGGMYKKLALACALLHRPEILVLDEPSNGVDPVSRRELWELLYRFVDEGMAVLLATPDMSEAARCHRVALLHRGRMLAKGSPAELLDAFGHAAFRLSTEARDETEDQLYERDEVLALSPEGSDLRVVVAQGAEQAFRKWASQAQLEIAEVEPTFEDVFLGLVAGEGEEDE